MDGSPETRAEVLQDEIAPLFDEDRDHVIRGVLVLVPGPA